MLVLHGETCLAAGERGRATGPESNNVASAGPAPGYLAPEVRYRWDMASSEQPPDGEERSPDEIACPSCGESEDLEGQRDGELIHIQCGACETDWHRDPRRRCPRCESGDLYAAPVAVIEKSRGTQLSIVSTRSEYLCWLCDRDLIDAQRQSGTALMPDQLPTL